MDGYGWPNQIDSTLSKMILNSVQEGDLNIIKGNLSKYNVDVRLLWDKENQKNAFFYSALIKDHDAALEVFKYLKDLGVDPTLKDSNLQTCLYYTCREGNYEVSKMLIEECGLEVNAIDCYGQNPMYYACREGKMKIAEWLISKGVDINLEDKYGQTCLYYAIRQDHFEMVELLIKHHIEWNKIDKKKQTPLAYAEKNGKTSIANLLIQNGAFKPEPKTKDKKQSRKKEKKGEKMPSTKEEIIESIQQPKRNILVKISKNGEKIPWTEEEINQFKIDNPSLAKLWYNKEERDKLCETANESLKEIDNWEKVAKKWMLLLWKTKDSSLFHKPVDPISLGLENYFEVIKNPMDFSTIKRKLNNFQYTNCKEFCNDMNWVFDNCFWYNGANSFAGNLCTSVKNEYLKLYEQLQLDNYI